MQDETEGSRTLSETTTKFIGNISFNDGEKDILVSDLATVEEVNEALSVCITNDKLDTYAKMFTSTEPTEPLYLNPNFEYKDDHVISSKAVKELIHLSSDTSSLPDMSEYRKVDDLQIDPVRKNAEVVYDEEVNAYGIKGYDPKLPMTVTFIHQEKELTITTKDDMRNVWHPPDSSTSQELNISSLTIRHPNVWENCDALDITDWSYRVVIEDYGFNHFYTGLKNR